MPKRTTQLLSEESKRHSDKALEHFKDASEMYEQMKDMPRSPARDEALERVLAEDAKAIDEMTESMNLNQEFLDVLDKK